MSTAAAPGPAPRLVPGVFPPGRLGNTPDTPMSSAPAESVVYQFIWLFRDTNMEHEKTAGLLAKSIAATLTILLLAGLGDAPATTAGSNLARQVVPAALPFVHQETGKTRHGVHLVSDPAARLLWTVRDAR